MITAKCININRDLNGNIISYDVTNCDGPVGNITRFRPGNLKIAIDSGQVIVKNLTLTSDRRLVQKKEPEVKSAPVKSDKKAPEAKSTPVKVDKRAIKRKSLFVMQVSNTYDASAKYHVEDLNGKCAQYSASELASMVCDQGYIGLNFRVLDDARILPKAPSTLNKAYALVRGTPNDFLLIRKSDGVLVENSAKELRDADGVEFDSNGVMQSFVATDISGYASSGAVCNYNVIKLMNHCLLEFSDHPEEATRAFIAALKGESCPEFGGSRGDDVRGLYKETVALLKRNIIRAHELTFIYDSDESKHENKNYSRLWHAMERAFLGRYGSNNKLSSDNIIVEVMKLCGLPLWTKELVKQQLYCLR